MVMRVGKNGVVYHEGPYTQDELEDLWRRVNAGPFTFTRAGPSASQQPPQPQPEQQTKSRRRPSRSRRAR
jgi:hypothetical protein